MNVFDLKVMSKRAEELKKEIEDLYLRGDFSLEDVMRLLVEQSELQNRLLNMLWKRANTQAGSGIV